MGRRGDTNYDIKKSDGTVIGEMSLVKKKSGYGNDSAYIDWITIDESERGKGYATDVLNSVLNEAKVAGYSKVSLDALVKARPLYQRMGFDYVDRSKKSLIKNIQSFEFGAKPMEYVFS